VVSTLAGTGAIGLDNGTGATATFNKPRGVAVDTSGFVYVTDYSNNVIRKISPDGVVSTLAGEGSIGLSNGSGATATFSSPYGLAVDSSGFVYVSDYNNDLIRKISPEGVVSTLAGAGFAGYGNGAGSNARFYGPSGVVLDSSGHLYVSDYLNRLIRKVSNAGVVSTVAGGAAQLTGSADGTGATASFFNPAGIAMDSSGHLYVADSYNHRIRKISPEGVVSTLAGTVACYNNFLEGTGATAKFYFPTGVAVDTSGNVFVADQLNHRIRMITSAGVVSTLAGVGWSGHADGTGATARFNYPYGVAIDNSGNLYVADNTNNQIRKITLLY
jgi:sugar lactone lactonase YvrE